ncbi:CS1-pili formation C-terminal domain-containing protein [Erwinia sp. V71]|uniref:CS1-pili formation C-terminal domain-containing protein n=1 Tax=Erwinia sp. V71 TaxID=3369424 RepID=UPI003F619E82
MQYVKVRTLKTYTLVSMLQDERGTLLTQRYVSSDVSGAMINAEGVLTLDSGVANPMLTVSAEAEKPQMLCPLPAADREQTVVFISALRCRTAPTGAEK